MLLLGVLLQHTAQPCTCDLIAYIANLMRLCQPAREYLVDGDRQLFSLPGSTPSPTGGLSVQLIRNFTVLAI